MRQDRWTTAIFSSRRRGWRPLRRRHELGRALGQPARTALPLSCRPAPLDHTRGMGSLGQRSTRCVPYAALGKHIPRLPSRGRFHK